MMGPLLAYRDDVHLDRLLETTRAAKIEIVRDEASRAPAFWFRRRWGLVHGTCWRTDSSRPVIYLGYGHPRNLLLWPSDGRLLREIRQSFLANGSSTVDPETLA